MGDGIEVRMTIHDGPNTSLIVHDTDPDDAPFVLVTPTDDPLTFTLVGWITGRDAKRAEWWRELQPGRPAFCVPQSALAHVFDLKDIACSAKP